MKNTMRSLFGTILCIAFLSSCQKEKQESLNGSVIFSVQTKDASKLKSSKAETEPLAANIIVTIEKDGGGVVYDKEKLELTYLNGTYLSKGLSLPVGYYFLTELLITDANNNVIYAAPKNGSKLAQLIGHPLPLLIGSYSNYESILAPEVIKTDSISLEDLGYVGFSFNYVENIKFFMNVFSKTANQTSFDGVDSSRVTIKSPTGKFYNYTLGTAGKVSPVYLNHDTGDYVVTVWKQGYNSWADTLTLSQLESYSATALNVILTPLPNSSIWFMGSVPNNGYLPNVFPSITVTPGATLYIDYGRGVSEKMLSRPTNNFDGYAGDRIVQIYGDVAGIKTLSFLCNKFFSIHFSSANIKNAAFLEEFKLSYMTIDGLDIQNMNSLKKVSYSNGGASHKFTNCTSLESINLLSSPDTVDVRTNDNLKEIIFDGSNPVLFGQNPNLKFVHIFDPYFHQTIAELNRLLIGLLASVESSPRSGVFDLSNFWPSNEGLEAARTLKTKFNWTFYPYLN